MKKLTPQQETARKEAIVDLYERVEHYAKNPSKDPLHEHGQVEEVVLQLLEIEKDINIALPDREKNWDAFKTWCQEHEIPVERFEIKKTGDNEYGLFTKQAFSENDFLLDVPRKAFLTNETALADPKLNAFVKGDTLFTHMPNLLLTFHLITEYANPKSAWAPYFKTLPSSYSTILYMKHAELEQLRGSPVLEEAVRIKRNIARQYAYFWMKIQSSPPNIKGALSCFTYELYRWALSTVMTRQNCVPGKKNAKQTTFALIPFWDMCNHREGKMTTDFNVAKDSLVFYSMRDVKPGDEIYNYYGDRSNAEFFLHNGFVFENHVYDSIKVKIGISKADPTFALKDALCKKIGLETYGDYQINNKSLPLNKKILAIVRIFLMDEEQLKVWLNEKMALDLYEENSKDLSHLNKKIQEFLSMRLQLLLKRYPQIDSFLNANVEKLVKSEKKILQSYSV